MKTKRKTKRKTNKKTDINSLQKQKKLVLKMLREF